MASSGYQMIAPFFGLGDMVPEIGYAGSDVVILVGKHRLTLNAAKREEWQRAFMAAERAAETYDPAHPF